MPRKKRSDGNPTSKLDAIYTNVKNKASFGSAQSLAAAAKVSLKEAQKYLLGVDAYTLHRPRRIKFSRNRYIVPGPMYLYEADLCDMREMADENQGFSYILNVIDVFSKYLWSVPLKNKTGKAVVDGLKTIFNGKYPKYFQSDLGLEFFNSNVGKYLKKNNVKQLKSRNELKCAVIERCNRTLKMRMHRYFTHIGRKKYIDVLQDFVSAYNHTKHSAIGRAPASVNKENAQEVWNYLYAGAGRYPKLGEDKKISLKVGTHVRVSRPDLKFAKGYEGQWLHEIFKIVAVIKNKQKILYELADYHGNKLDARFYREEIQPVNVNRDTQYKIDKIIKTFGKGARKRLLVKWTGYPDSFNSIIYEKDLIRK
jgi:hypothetical protein